MGHLHVLYLYPGLDVRCILAGAFVTCSGCPEALEDLISCLSSNMAPPQSNLISLVDHNFEFDAEISLKCTTMSHSHRPTLKQVGLTIETGP